MERPHRIRHTMLRVKNLEQSVSFYTDFFVMKTLRRRDYEEGRFTLVFLGFENEEKESVIELTYNWDQNSYDLGNGFGHLGFAVKDIYKFCQFLGSKGVLIIREPGPMKFDQSEVIAFVQDPDGYKIELIQD